MCVCVAHAVCLGEYVTLCSMYVCIHVLECLLYLHSLHPPLSRMSGRVSTETAPSRPSDSDTLKRAFQEDGLVVTSASSLTNLLEGEETQGEEYAEAPDGGKQLLVDRGVEDDVIVGTHPIKPHPPSHKRVLPTPPSSRPDLPPRPRTVADFRVRRLRRHSAEVSLVSQEMEAVVDRTHFDSPGLGGAELGKEGQWGNDEYVCVCVCVCVRACVRVRVRACVRACIVSPHRCVVCIRENITVPNSLHK